MNGSSKDVTISRDANGTLVATPASVTKKRGHKVVFESDGSTVREFTLDFAEPPGDGEAEKFRSTNGKVTVTLKSKLDSKKYKGSDPARWKHIAYAIRVGNDASDPEVIIDPN